MRPYCIIIAAVTVLLACFEAAEANSSPVLSSNAVSQLSSKRMLRATTEAKDAGDDEERTFGLEQLKLWNMRRSANSEIKAANKAKAKAAAEVQKKATKEANAAAKKSAQEAAKAAEAQKKAAKEAQAAATKSAQETAKAAKAKAVEAKLAAAYIGKGWSPERVGEFLKAEKYVDNQEISKFMETYKDMYAKAWGKDAAAAAKAEAKAA